MTTANVIHRTFHIRWGERTGTAFALDRDDKQYLITARHVVKNIKTGDLLLLFHDKQWKKLPIDVIGLGEDKVDVAVLSAPQRVAPSHVLEASTVGMVYGQDIFFLGYPFGWDSGGESINRDFPLPFVKAGVVSALPFGDPSLLFIDAHGNPGFSGGPVVFREGNQQGTEFKVAGVVAEAPTPRLRPVVNKLGKPMIVNGNERAFFAENQGFVVAVDIKHALEMIDANPVGFSLPPEEAG